MRLSTYIISVIIIALTPIILLIYYSPVYLKEQEQQKEVIFKLLDKQMLYHKQKEKENDSVKQIIRNK